MNRMKLLTAAVAMLAVIGTANAQAKKPFAATGSGTIKGKITLDGAAPAGAKAKIDPGNKDAAHCMKGDTEDLTWVSEGGGLGNVVVFLKPPAGQYFKVDMAKKTWEDEVVIDQPYCAFKPHVSILFCEYEGKATPQKFTVKNSAPILHNSRVAGNPLKNPAKGETLTAGGSKAFVVKADTQVIKINCDAHKWMEAYVWAFDHPYAAVTKPDGTFEIKNAPTGAEVEIMAWHEVGAPNAGVSVKKAALKDGDTIEFKIKKK